MFAQTSDCTWRQGGPSGLLMLCRSGVLVLQAIATLHDGAGVCLSH